MSRWTTFCDAVVEDLQGNIPRLENVLVHRYAPWDPEHLSGGEWNEAHLAVFPSAEATEDPTPLVTGPGGDLLVNQYRILYWEPAGDEQSRAIADEDAASDLLNLLEQVIDRFYVIENLRIGDTELTQYRGTSLPDRSSSVRWFQVTVLARRTLVAS